MSHKEIYNYLLKVAFPSIAVLVLLLVTGLLSVDCFELITCEYLLQIFIALSRLQQKPKYNDALFRDSLVCFTIQNNGFQLAQITLMLCCETLSTLRMSKHRSQVGESAYYELDWRKFSFISFSLVLLSFCIVFVIISNVILFEKCMQLLFTTSKHLEDQPGQNCWT